MEWSFVIERKADSSYVFRLEGWDYPVFYIGFGNGDKDTLTRDWSPNKELPSAIENLNYLRFYLNGDLVSDWNFEQIPNLKWELWERNMSYRKPVVDPIIIPLVKDN